MLHSLRARRTSAARLARAASALAVVALVAACGDDDDPSGPDEEPQIEFVRLTVTPAGGTATTYTVRTSGAPTTVQVRVGANAIQATAFDAANQAIDVGSDFELRLVQAVAGDAETALPAQYTFARNGTLSSTLTVTAGAPTPQTAVVRMFHKEEGHSDFDPPVQIQVVP